MPNSEDNDIPRGQPYGTAKAQEDFIAATEPAVQQQEEFAPVAITPNALPEFVEPEALPTDELAGTGDMDPEEFGLLSEPTDTQPQDLDAVRDWLPALQELAAMPGASEGMRALAQAIQQRVEG